MHLLERWINRRKSESDYKIIKMSLTKYIKYSKSSFTRKITLSHNKKNECNNFILKFSDFKWEEHMSRYSELFMYGVIRVVVSVFHLVEEVVVFEGDILFTEISVWDGVGDQDRLTDEGSLRAPALQQDDFGFKFTFLHRMNHSIRWNSRLPPLVPTTGDPNLDCIRERSKS